MEVLDLRKFSHAIAQLARWHHAEWAHQYPEQTLQEYRSELHESLGRRVVPSTWVLIDGEQLMGSASVVMNELPGYPGQRPWLANVYLPPHLRGIGLGSRLVESVMSSCRQAELAQLHLFTADRENFYTRLGWCLLQHRAYQGQRVAIMRYDFETAGTPEEISAR